MSARGSSKWRRTHWGPPCKPKTVRLPFVPGVRISVDHRTKDAFKALATVLQAHNYKVRSKDTGAYNCRKMKGSNSTSSHSWAIAVDINWQTNPYGKNLVTDMPKEMVRDVLAIKTKKGLRVFRWGGDWDNRPETKHSNYDAMHFEIVVTPQELAVGIDWTTVEQGDDMASEFKRGAKGAAVRLWQKRLNQTSFGDLQLDGVFGEGTERAVNRFKEHLGLEVDGVLDVTTMIQLQATAHGVVNHRA